MLGRGFIPRIGGRRPGDADVGADLVVDDDVALRRDAHDVDAVGGIARDDVARPGRSRADRFADVVVRGRDQDAVAVVVEDVVALDHVAGAGGAGERDAVAVVPLDDVPRSAGSEPPMRLFELLMAMPTPLASGFWPGSTRLELCVSNEATPMKLP